MLSKKLAALTVVIGVLASVGFNKIYVPDNFERPWFFKTCHAVFAIFGAMVS